MDTDRISGLPDPILQHILCLLSQKDAIRTSVLSKSWRHHWSTLPVLDFRGIFFGDDKPTFLSVLDNTLQRYNRQNLPVERFRVGVSDYGLVRWIRTLLIYMGVDDIHLFYTDPPSDSLVFRAERLTELYLDDGCDFFFCPECYFTCLKSLHLAHVYLLNANQSFHKFSSNFPCLEELEIRDCYGFNRIELFHPLIKRLVILGTEWAIKDVTVNAPNILYFEFSSISLPSVFSFTSAAAASSREWKSRVSLPFKLRSKNKDVSPWFLKLNGLLKELRESRITLNLFNQHKANRHFIDTSRVGFHKPVELERLSLKDFSSSDSFAALFDGLFRVFRPRYIDMGLFGKQKSKNNQLAEFILCKANLEEGEFSRGYFWHRDLKEFSMDIFDQHSKEWCRVQGSSLTETQLRQDIRFRFEWREFDPIAFSKLIASEF